MIILAEFVLDRFRWTDRCEWCGVAIGGCADPHHIFPRGIGGGSRLDYGANLIGLCRTCHQAAQAYKIERQELLARAAEREIRRLKRAPKGSKFCPDSGELLVKEVLRASHVPTVRGTHLHQDPGGQGLGQDL